MNPSSTPFREGDIIASKYEVRRVLGAGGMGVVVAARHLELNEMVALKFLLPEVANDHEQRGRFLREARAAVRIKSQHVAHVLDVGCAEPDTPFIVMEYLEGMDLAARMVSSERVTLRQAVDFLLQACEGLAEAHALGIVHRDLKPSNLFLCRTGDGRTMLKVMDFGISKLTAVSGDPAGDKVVTRTGGVIGSPAYMAPEQIRGAKYADVRSDLWSLGVILYELLSGEVPFVAESVGALFGAVLADDPIPLQEACPGVPPELSAIVMKCLRKNPAERYQSVSEFAQALRSLESPSLSFDVRGDSQQPVSPVAPTLIDSGATVRAVPTAATSAPDYTPVKGTTPKEPTLQSRAFGSSSGVAIADVQAGSDRSQDTPKKTPNQRTLAVGIAVGAFLLVSGWVGLRLASPLSGYQAGPAPQGSPSAATVSSEANRPTASVSSTPSSLLSADTAAAAQGSTKSPGKSSPTTTQTTKGTSRGPGELEGLIDERR